MNKYDKIVEIQKTIGQDNEEKAIEAIQYLYSNNKLISVKELVKLTGLSRSYFYKNQNVNGLLNDMMARQGKSSSIRTKDEVFNKALEKSYKVLEKQVETLQRKNKMLMEENEELKVTIRKMSTNEGKSL